MISELILNGKIPYFQWVKRLISMLTFLALLVFFIPDEYKEFGEIGWNLLTFVVFIRPLSDLFPRLGILKSLSALRKELGIMSGIFIIAHGIGYLLTESLPLTSLFYNSDLWNFSNELGWGTLGFITALILLLTSNQFAIRILKKYWKPVQRLVYLFFLTGAIHITFVEEDQFLKNAALVIAFVILWILSAAKVVFWPQPKKEKE